MPRSCVAERDLRIPPSPYSDTRFDRKIADDFVDLAPATGEGASLDPA